MTKICCVCNEEKAAYKCPICRQSYCSVSCCQHHKEVGCAPPEPEPTNDDLSKSDQKENKYDFPTEDTVPLEKLKQLQYSEEVRSCLKNPHVRDIVKAILRDKNATKAIRLAMTEPIFVELADACLKVIEPQNQS